MNNNFYHMQTTRTKRMSLLMYTVLSCACRVIFFLKTCCVMACGYRTLLKCRRPKYFKKRCSINIQLLLNFAPAIMYQNMSIKEINTSVFSEFCCKSLNKYVHLNIISACVK